MSALGDLLRNRGISAPPADVPTPTQVKRAHAPQAGPVIQFEAQAQPRVTIDAPGIYDISEDAYHADPCPQASLSSSIARILINDSPRHAWNAHPRLNPNWIQSDRQRHLDLGSLCHALLLEGENKAVVLPYENYRTKTAQEARDEARANGKYPVLAHEMPDIHAMMAACREQIVESEVPDAFTDGKAEQVLIWQEFNGVWCRARVDWMMSKRPEMQDYKTGAMSMHPTQFSKRIAANGLDVQEAFYRRGFKAIFGLDPIFRFIAQENFAPFALSVNSLSPSLKTYGEQRVQYAIDTFGKCSQSGKWPGYPTYVCAAELSPWDERSWREKEK